MTFITELNRVVWDQLQKPVIGLTALRQTLMPKIEEILKMGEGSSGVEESDQNIALGDRAGADVDVQGEDEAMP